MKHLTVVILAACSLVALGAKAGAQTLKERSLNDAPAASHAPAGAGQPAPTGQPAATVSPVATPQAAPPAPAQAAAPTAQPAPAPAPAAQPAPMAQQPAPAAQPAPQTPPPPGTGGTPINGSVAVSPPPPPPPPPAQNTYNQKEIDREVQGFFEKGSRGLAQIVANAFRDLGQPNGFIKGNEAGGALVVGLRYGAGTLYLKGLPPVPVYWQSPSVGLDLGVNAGKVFTLVYGLDNPNQIFQRFPAVDGSAYVLGGFGVNYQRSGNITLSPIRFGVGLRLGANVGYQSYTRTQSANPF